MICFLVRKGYEFTVFALMREPEAPRISVRPYEDVLRRSELPQATYVFTDLDRLDIAELNDAARLFRRLKDSGCLVLNDPARVRTRLSLLRSLHRSGLNPLNAYSLDDGEMPERFPVFIRIAEEHTAGPLTGLIQDQEELKRAIEALLEAGYARRGLIVTEYAAEPASPGLFRKLSVFRVGERYLPHVCVHDQGWIVKAGRPGIAPMELYDEELEMLRTNPFAGAMKKVFENAEIDFGRVDFGLVGGRPCVYEINTNPTIGPPIPHPVPQRVESMKLWWKGLLSALEAIDRPPGPSSAPADVSGDSVTALSAALEVYPALTDGFVQLSREHLRRGDLDTAIECAEAGMVRSAADAKSIAHLSELMAEAGRLPEAIALADRAVKHDPKDANTLFLSVKHRLAAGRGDDTLAAVRRALEERREDAGLVIRLSRLLASDESLTGDALELAQLAISLRPEDGSYHSHLSQIHSQSGNLEAALEAATRALELSSRKDKPAAAQAVKALKTRRRWQWLNTVKQPIRRMLDSGGQTHRFALLREKLSSTRKD